MVLVPYLVGAAEITVRPQWNAGDRFLFEQVKTRQEAGRPEASGTSRTPVHLEVLSASEKGYQVRWRYGKTQLPAGRELPAALARAEELMLDLALEVELSPLGEYRKVLNEAQVGAKMGEVFRTVAASLGPDAPEIPLLKQMLQAQPFLNTALSDLQSYCSMYGITLREQEKVRLTRTQSFALQPGRMLQVQVYAGLGREGEESYTFGSDTEYDIQQLEDRMRELLLNNGVRIQDRAQMPQLFLSEKGEYTFDRKRGLLSRVLVVRQTTIAPGLDRTERYEFVLQ